MNQTVKFVLIFMFSMCFYSANAGWKLTCRLVDKEGTTIPYRLYIEGQKIKIERHDFIYTADLSTGSLILIDPINLLYCETTLLEYATKNNILMTSRLRMAEKTDNPATNDTIFDSFPLNAETGNYLPPVSQDSVNWRKTSDSLRVSNYTAYRYVFSAGKTKLEEVWLAPELKLKDEINWRKLYEFLTVVDKQGIMVSYMLTPEYEELMKIGYPVRKFIYNGFIKTDWQVNLIEEKKIPAYEFYKPDLCKKLNIDDWIAQSTRADYLDDDYE
jgi:hypothetical protein